MLPEGCIKRTTSTIPFGYELDEQEGYLRPIDDQILALSVASFMVKEDEVSLRDLSLIHI